jgi:hypothetical protein
MATVNFRDVTLGETRSEGRLTIVVDGFGEFRITMVYSDGSYDQGVLTRETATALRDELDRLISTPLTDLHPEA